MNDVSGLQHLLARSTVGVLPPPGGYQPAARAQAPSPPVQARLPAADPPEILDEQDTAPSWPRYPMTENASGGIRPLENPAAETDFSFADFLDIINPLQHIPIVSTIYRSITGDEISGAARIFGGALFGGPLGFVVAIVNSIFDEINGKDLGETVLAALTGGDEPAATDPVEGIAIARAGPGQLVAEAVQEPLVTAAGSKPEAYGPTQMTGQVALDALANDLRGWPRPAEQQVATVIPAAPVIPVVRASLDAQSAPLPGGGAPGLIGSATAHSRGRVAGAVVAASADPRFIGAALTGGALADRMMYALDKYRTMVKGHGAVPAGRRFDGKF